MATTAHPVTLELVEADHAILDLLAEGRCTTGYLADELPYSRQHIHNRLSILQAADAVRKVHDGTALYELIRDPRQ